MALTETNYHKYTFETTVYRDRIKAFASFIFSYGFGFESDADVIGWSNVDVLTIPGLSGVGLFLKTSSGSSVTVGPVFKAANGKWFATNANGAGCFAYNGVALSICTINGVTRYGVHGVYPSGETTTPDFMFAELPLVNYFTTGKRSGFWYGFGSNVNRFFLYDETTHFASDLTATDIGVPPYPTNYDHVAAPVVFVSTEGFYGYINTSSSFYMLYHKSNVLGNTSCSGLPGSPDPADYTGYTFQEMFPQIYARK